MASRNDLEEDKGLIWNTRLPYENESRTSPAFSLMGSEWCLRFIYCTDQKCYHVIYLHQMSDGKIVEELKNLQKSFHVNCSMMSMKDHDNDETADQKITVTQTRSYIWYSGAEKDKIFKTLPWLYDSPEVKVACRFRGQPPSIFRLQIGTGNRCLNSTIEKSVQVSQEVPRDIESLSNDFSHLLEKEVLPDMRLECGGQTFQAHRSVLVARSKVFLAMFQNETLESKTGAVKIPDMDVAVLEKLLKFLYTGKPEELSEDCTADLYEASDKYDVLSLKMACSYWIERNLNLENCLKYLRVSDSHSDDDLKATVVSFITENPSVMKSETWFAFSKELPVLAKEVLQTYVSSIVP